VNTSAAVSEGLGSRSGSSRRPAASQASSATTGTPPMVTGAASSPQTTTSSTSANPSSSAAIEQIGSRDEDACPALGEHPLEQRSPQLGIQRHRHSAGQLRAEEHRHELDLIAQEERDMRGAIRPGRGERARDPLSAFLRLGEREAVASVEHEPVLVRTLANLLVQHVQQRALFGGHPERERPETGPGAARQA
jgi:hypothetical protein